MRSRTIPSAVLAGMLVAVFALSQSFTASIRGVVTDATGASIPRATVTVTDADRNVQYRTITDEEGRYVVTALPPGNYTIAIEASGFKRFVRSAFPLSVQQQATIDAQLEVGEITATVEVAAEAPLLNTTIANLGQVIENKYIISLPNIGRNPMIYVYLTPGVVGSGGRRGDANTNFVANGARNSTSDVLLDVVTLVTVEQNSGITDLKYAPSIDVVQEFKMQTNFFSAEYGQTGGAVVNMVTRSGTNEFHGTGYYFLRHSDLNANDWFANRAGRAIPYYRRDQLGGVISGPIVKDRTFFLGSLEYTRTKSPLTFTATFPTLLQREGDFSQTRNPAGQVMTIFNPFDTFVNAAGNLERRPFPGNVVPKSMMDPVALKALAYFPKPNQPGHPITETNNWFEQGINVSRGPQTNLRGDHHFNENNRISGRYSHTRSRANPPNVFGDLAPAFTFNFGPNLYTATSVVSEYTRPSTRGSKAPRRCGASATG